MSKHATKMSKSQRQAHAARAIEPIAPASHDDDFIVVTDTTDVPAYLRIHSDYLSNRTNDRVASHWQSVDSVAGEVWCYEGKPMMLDRFGFVWADGIRYMLTRRALQAIVNLFK